MAENKGKGGEVKNFERERYQLKPLPVELAKEVIAKSEDYLRFLTTEAAVSTHPAIRAITFAIEKSLTQLKADTMTQELGPGRDEMDAWLDSGIGRK
jgi:hypothetical protein